MVLEPANILLGAVAALIAREAVDAHKARRQREASADATMRAVKQELAELEEIAVSNMRGFRKGADEWAGMLTTWSAVVKPLQPLPTRLDELLRQTGSDDLLRNAEVLRALSRVVTVAKYLNAVEDARMRFVAVQDPQRLAFARSQYKEEFNTEDLANTLEGYEYELKENYSRLLDLLFFAKAIVGVIENDRQQQRAFGYRFRTFVISIGRWGFFGGQAYPPSEGQRRFLELLLTADEYDIDRVLRDSGLSHDEADVTVGIMRMWGLTDEIALMGRLPELTPRGRAVAGSGARRWIRPTRPDPPIERFDWANYPSLDRE